MYDRGQQLLLLLGRTGQPPEFPVDSVRVNGCDTAGQFLFARFSLRTVHDDLDRSAPSADGGRLLAADPLGGESAANAILAALDFVIQNF